MCKHIDLVIRSLFVTGMLEQINAVVNQCLYNQHSSSSSVSITTLYTIPPRILQYWESPAVLSTVCSAYQSPCRGEMWQQSSAPWGGHSWTAGGEVWMFRRLHDVSIFTEILFASNYFVIVLYYSEWNPLIAPIARPSVDRCAAVYQQFAMKS